jgi:hypothetical protein
MYNDDEASTSPRSEMDVEGESTQTGLEDILFDGDLEALEAELQLNLSSDAPQKMEEEENIVSNESKSDDLFDDFDDIAPEELDALFSSNEVAAAPPQETTTTIVDDDDDALFDDDDFMDIDFDETQPGVVTLLSD